MSDTYHIPGSYSLQSLGSLWDSLGLIKNGVNSARFVGGV